MGRNKKLIDDSCYDVRDKVPRVDYSKLFILIDELGCSQREFCNIAHISPSTLERLKKNEDARINTLCKIINGLNKLDKSGKKYQIDDLISYLYQKGR